MLTSINPATKQPIGSVDSTPLSTMEMIFESASTGANEWAALRLSRRSQILRLVRKNLIAKMDELSHLIAEETGKTYWEGFLEVFTTAEHLRHISKYGPTYLRSTPRSSGIFITKKCYVNYLPHGVVGIISPWNYPLILTAAPVVEALMSGNSVVLKPSEFTPLTCQLMTSIFHEAGIPKNVLQTVYGYGDLGALIVNSQHTDMICFTGSVEVGRKIAVSCAELLKPVVLELGGKDPMIVLEDANLERAATAAVWGGFSNCGQTCISVERVFVHEKIADRFIQLVKDKTEQLTVGPDKNNADIGSLINEKQFDIVRSHLAGAQQKNLASFFGGDDLSELGGYFLKPAVVEVTDDQMDIMQKETFGPEICIMRIQNSEEAIAKANNTGYGLSAAIFTNKKKKGQQLARRLRAGSVCINDVLSNYITADLPFGGVGISGIGRVHGAEGLRSFSQTQSILVDRFGLNRELWWYPVHSFTKRIFKTFTKIYYG